MSARRGGAFVPEPHEQWVGLAYVERHGLPGYAPPIVRAPSVDPHTRMLRKLAKRTRERIAARTDWSDA